MDAIWAAILGTLGAFATGVAYLCERRPRVAMRVCEYLTTIAVTIGLVSGGGLTSSIIAKAAVGALAAGMYAEDFAITDGDPGTDSNEIGRYVVSRIASSVDPIIMINLRVVIAALLTYVICRAAVHFSQVVLDDGKTEHDNNG
ncbi:hypothetical protein HPA02_11400 [Bisbaumannia pacifica]|uniref:Uncharacterized protein n=1 Tax=Bisbaumannia pacifica TaxID=77098 RepID=A0A510X812_9GAMM|nr:hypothetical protein [Halomonas pacifica]GEK46857.1 hypothetical protein HPA02_11400 [Halomonas pacifica]